jgi:hypothetical protein
MQNDMRFTKVLFEPFWPDVELVKPVSRLLNTGNHLIMFAFEFSNFSKLCKKPGGMNFTVSASPFCHRFFGEDASHGFLADNTGSLNWSKPAGPRSDH